MNQRWAFSQASSAEEAVRGDVAVITYRFLKEIRQMAGTAREEQRRRFGFEAGCQWQPLPVLACQVGSAAWTVWGGVPVVTWRFVRGIRQMAGTARNEQRRRFGFEAGSSREWRGSPSLC
jgi:hypothetical protein